MYIENCAHNVYYSFNYASQQGEAPPKPGVYMKLAPSNHPLSSSEKDSDEPLKLMERHSDILVIKPRENHESLCQEREQKKNKVGTEVCHPETDSLQEGSCP